MIDISINKVSKSYGFGNILDNISLDINSGEIISIVGDNGSGKSTLLKMIAKEENPTSGVISIRKGTSIGYLSQIANLEDNRKVKDILYRSVKDVFEIEERLKKYEEKMLGANDKELDIIIKKYSELQEKYINLGGMK